jgi:hypothetical protein
MWWCFIVVPPYIGKAHKYEQDHIITKLKPLNEQNTMNKKKNQEHNIMTSKNQE